MEPFPIPLPVSTITMLNPIQQVISKCFSIKGNPIKKLALKTNIVFNYLTSIQIVKLQKFYQNEEIQTQRI